MTLWHAVAVATAVVLALAGPAPGPAQPKVLADRMLDFQVTPIEPLTPPPLDVATTTGVRVSLSDVKGQAALIYFWATW